MTDAKPCPFCGNAVDSVALEDDYGNRNVRCRCGARGPSADNEREAIDLWNIRSVDAPGARADTPNNAPRRTTWTNRSG